jgi:hypothetical protein
MTIGELAHDVAQRLGVAGIDDARVEAELVGGDAGTEIGDTQGGRC